MWFLQLNDMRSAHVEDLQPVFRSESKGTLEKLLTDERVDMYRDGKWCKTFRQGGPLEWFNAPSANGDAWINVPALVEVVEEESVRIAAEAARARYAGLLAHVPTVESVVHHG